MQRARQHIPSFMGAYIPPCGDVAGGVVIRVGDKATVCASERGNGIASLVEHADCLFQTLGLFNAWQQLYLQGQFHNVKIVNIFEFTKYLKEIINPRRNVAQFLPRLKSWVSLSRIS